MTHIFIIMKITAPILPYVYFIVMIADYGYGKHLLQINQSISLFIRTVYSYGHCIQAILTISVGICSALFISGSMAHIER